MRFFKEIWVVLFYAVSMILAESVHHFPFLDTLHHINSADEKIMWDDVVYWFMTQQTKCIASFAVFFYVRKFAKILEKKNNQRSKFRDAQAISFSIFVVQVSWLWDEIMYMMQWDYRLLEFENSFYKIMFIIFVMMGTYTLHQLFYLCRMKKLYSHLR